MLKEISVLFGLGIFAGAVASHLPTTGKYLMNAV
jgi:hypothetical protein